MINWRSSSGSASIVGVTGQMSAALSASSDAWLTPRPQSGREDEVVTQSSGMRKEERRKRRAHRRQKNLCVWSPDVSADVSINPLSQDPGASLTPRLLQTHFYSLCHAKTS